MQIVTVPLFNRDMVVEAYLFRYRKGNDLFSTTQATGVFDGASRSEVLELLSEIGLEAFSLGKPVFVPISYIMLLGDLAGQCAQAQGSIVFLFEEPPKPEEPYLSKMAQLREQGYQFALNNLRNPQDYLPVLEHCSYFFLSQKENEQAASKEILTYLATNFRRILVVASNVRSPELLESLRTQRYYLFETRFARLAVSSDTHGVNPLKMNSIRLINVVQDENFEFEEVSKIVQTDPALTVSLLRIVNTRSAMRSQVKTIPQAVALLGQREVRKWVTTAVTQMMGSDRPNEITRVSLVRAKFAENLAPLFEMAHMAQGLFLMGLFSVLDLILEVPMAEALEMVVVPDTVKKALTEQSGLFAPVLALLEEYEGADWSGVSRRMIVHDLNEDDLANAYIEALTWYRDLILQDDEDVEVPVEAEAVAVPEA